MKKMIKAIIKIVLPVMMIGVMGVGFMWTDEAYAESVSSETVDEPENDTETAGPTYGGNSETGAGEPYYEGQDDSGQAFDGPESGEWDGEIADPVAPVKPAQASTPAPESVPVVNHVQAPAPETTIYYNTSSAEEVVQANDAPEDEPILPAEADVKADEEVELTQPNPEKELEFSGSVIETKGMREQKAEKARLYAHIATAITVTIVGVSVLTKVNRPLKRTPLKKAMKKA